MPAKKLKIHFIGIGGIGVSALAKYYLEKSHKVSGSDLVSSEITDALKRLGTKIFIGKHKAENVPKDVNLVIYSPAIQESNPELKQALKIKNLKLKIKILSYPEALGELTKQHFTIAVCGTHGKSTTAAMIGILLVKAGFNPTVIVGTKLKEFAPPAGGSNCRVGKSKYLVIEADEHFASFLNYRPKIIVLTALEPDHLDYYKNFRNYISAFKKFISYLPKDGTLVANGDDKSILRMLKSKINPPAGGQKSKIQFKTQKYSLKQKETKKIRKVLKIPGEFNISNALATLTVARALNVPDKISFKALSEYRGSWRRFEIVKTKPFILISDYGHHPTEIKVTLKAAREKWPKREIWCVFQPHQHQRTYYLFDDFVKVFRTAVTQKWIDKLIITDIYDVAGREKGKIKKKVNSKKLVTAIRESCERPASPIYLSKEKIIDYLKENLRGREAVLIMGAGDIYNLTLGLTKKTKSAKIENRSFSKVE